jgi:hypothetical protein
MQSTMPIKKKGNEWEKMSMKKNSMKGKPHMPRLRQ